MELADTSAWTARQRAPELDAEFSRLLENGAIATCDAVVYELLKVEPDDVRVIARRDDLDRVRTIPVGPRVWRRALDIVEELAALSPGRHRPFPLADVLVAAAAERAGISVLHYDRHFEVIASVTGQPVRAIAPLGSL